MDYFIVWVSISLSRQLRSYRHIRDYSATAATTADEDIEDIDDIEEDIVPGDVEVVEENGSLDGNSSIQETKK